MKLIFQDDLIGRLQGIQVFPWSLFPLILLSCLFPHKNKKIFKKGVTN